ncbi:MAG TPA: C25 family cysteine peptidase [Planctomycetota bacterium]|nr:C25 family cysteine peptidase [Planctomycetota bacterium]
MLILACGQAIALTDSIASSVPPIVQGTVQTLSGQSIALDASGNRFVTGKFSGTLDFNPGVGVDAKTSAGGSDAFVTRFNADGSYAWTQTFGGSGDDIGVSVVVSSAAVYVTGFFNSADAKIGGAGPPIGTSGSNDAFVIALDASSGAPLSTFGLAGSGVQIFGGSGSDTANALAVGGGVLYVTGTFASTDAKIGNAGPSVATAGGTDVFVIALNATTGAALNSFGLASSGIQKFGGTNSDTGLAIALSASTVYLGGSFVGSVQIGGAGPTVTSTGGQKGFIVALKVSDGSAQTVFGLSSSGIQEFGGTSTDTLNALALNGSTLFAAGSFSSTNAQIGGTGPGVGVTSIGFSDAFVIALDASSGQAKSGFGLGGGGIQTIAGANGRNIALGLAANDSGVYAVGQFAAPLLQIGGAGPSVKVVGTSGRNDAFIVALDSTTGLAKTSFGVASSGIQTISGTSDEIASGVVLTQSTLYVGGSVGSTNARVGTGGYIGGGSSFMLALNPNDGTTAMPLITSPLFTVGGVNLPYNYSATAVPTATNFSAANLPAGLNLNSQTGAISGTVTAAGVYLVQLSATTPAGVVNAVLTISMLGDDIRAFLPIIQGNMNDVSGPGQALALDPAGNLYVTGFFQGAVDFNLGLGIDPKLAPPSANNAFVTRINANGSYGWTQTFGGSSGEVGNAVALSPDGMTVYLAGSVSSIDARIGTSGPIISAIGAQNAFVLALDAATGSAKSGFGIAGSGVQIFGGTGSDMANALAVTATTLYLGGAFTSVGAQVGGSGVAVSPVGGRDGFVLALDPTTGAPLTSFGLSSSGVQTFGGTSSDVVYALVAGNGKIYACGSFNSSTVRIGGAGPSISQVANLDAYIMALDAATGAAVSSFGLSSSGIQTFAGTNSEVAYALALNGSTLYVAGNYAAGNAKIGGTGPIAPGTASGGFVLELDATSGAAKTNFGPNASGIQTFSGGGGALNIALSATTVYASGYTAGASMQIGGAGPTVPRIGGLDACVVALDAVTGLPNGNFGLLSSGIQLIGGGQTEAGCGMVLNGSSLWVAGAAGSSRVGVGGFGPYDATVSSSFVMPLDAATGAIAIPAISSPLTVGTAVNKPFSYALTTTGAMPTFLAASNLPAWLSFNSGNGMLSGTPPAVGTYTITLGAGYSGGAIQAPLTIVVLADATATPPVVQAGTLNSTNSVKAVALDAAGNKYVAGSFTGTVDFNRDTGTDIKTPNNGADVFVTRYNADASYGWTQVFGGRASDTAQAVAVSPDGSTVYVTGVAGTEAQIGNSGPLIGGFGSQYGFVLALDAATGAPKTSFGISGTGIQIFGDPTLDVQPGGAGIVCTNSTLYVCGSIVGTVRVGNSTATVTTSGIDACVIALDPVTGAPKTSFGLSGSGIQKFGGSNSDSAAGIAVSGTTVYVTGTNNSTNATLGGTGTSVNATNGHTFVIALDATTGAAVLTFGISGSGIQTFGGSGTDAGLGVVVNGSTVFVTGNSNSTTWRIGANPTITGPGLVNSGFVIALDATTGAPRTSFGVSASGIQKLGGSLGDSAFGIAGNASALYVVGQLISTDFAIGGSGAHVGTSGGTDAFVVALDPVTGTGINSFGFSSSGIQKFGGSGSDSAYGVAVNTAGVYVAGTLGSSDAGVGGLGTYDGTGFGGFLLRLDLSSGVTPVTLADFSAQAEGAGVLITWSAFSEFQNAGFNLFRRIKTNGAPGTWMRVNPSLIAGRITSPEFKRYSVYDWAVPGAYEYKLESVSINGFKEAHAKLAGPVDVDSNVDLNATRISPEGVGAAGCSVAAAADAIRTRALSAVYESAVGRRSLGHASGIEISNSRPLPKDDAPVPINVAQRWYSGNGTSASGAYVAAKFVYSESGVLKIPKATLPAGFDIGHCVVEREGRTLTPLALASDGLIVFGAGYQDEYTDKDALFVRNISTRTLAGTAIRSQGLFDGTTPVSGEATAAAMTNYHDVYFDFDFRPYTFAPWFSSQYLTGGTTQPFTIDTPFANGGAATLTVNLWSLTQSNTVTPDHTLQVLVNGQPVGQALWSGGGKMMQFNFAIAAGVLKNGGNRVDLATPEIVGVDTQIALLHSLTMAYTRALDGSRPVTIFHSGPASTLYELRNVPSADAWVVDVRFPDRAVLVPYQTKAQADGTYALRFNAAAGGTGQFWVVPVGQEIVPQALGMRSVKPLKAGSSYIAVGPAEFGGAVQPLLEQHSKEGLRASFADQEQVFDYYAFGRYGPAGIQSAVRSVRPRYVLLVGRTTYDYRNFTGQNVNPLCPTFLVSTSFWSQATSDSMYGDLGRGFPEVAVGRLPVNSANELSVAVNHVLAYKGIASSGIRVHAIADRTDPSAGDFGALLDEVALAHPEMAWQRNYLGTTSNNPADITAALKTAANGAADLLMYSGHGNALRLGKDDPRILDTDKVQEWIGNTILLQATCTANWMARNVTDYKSIAIQALTQPQGGISASIASSTYLTAGASVEFMNQLLKNSNVSGMRWGDALLKTQQWAYAKGGGFYADLSKTEQIFGDPAMPVFSTDDKPASPSGTKTGNF